MSVRTVMILVFAASMSLFAAASAQACTVPVFRYALERWDAAPYEVVVFTKGKAAGEKAAAIGLLEKASSATDDPNGTPPNFVLQNVDVNAPIPVHLAELWQAQKPTEFPWVVINYPMEDEKEHSCFAGPLTAELAQRFVDSPARRQVAKALLGGDSAVWIQVDSGNALADDTAHGMLQGALAKFAKEFELPVIDPEDPTSKLRSTLPLKLKFSVIRIARDSAEESMFLQMMIASEPEIASMKGPLLFAVFGRGRVLPPIGGKDLLDSTVRDYSTFLCGACSCEVKTLNPGTDLMMRANWESIFDERPVEEPARAPLAGTSVAIPPGYVKSIATADTRAGLDAETARSWFLVSGASVLAAFGLAQFMGRKSGTSL